VGGKGESLRGFRPNGLPLPPLDSEQREGGEPTGWPAGRAPAGGPVHDGGRRMGENGEGSEGDRFPSSPWVGRRGGGSTGGGGLEVVVLEGGGALVLRKEGGSDAAVRGEPGSYQPLFIGAERQFVWPIFRACGAPAAGNGYRGQP
jgi:hypothetical protein